MVVSTLAQVVSSTSGSGGGSGAFLVIGLLYLAVLVAMIAGAWKIFTKAGEPGWASLIPIYNTYVMLRIVGRPGWWVVLMFIPIVSLVVGIIVSAELAEAFGKGTGYALGLIFLPFIFIPLLGFSDAEHQLTADTDGQY